MQLFEVILFYASLKFVSTLIKNKIKAIEKWLMSNHDALVLKNRNKPSKEVYLYM